MAELFGTPAGFRAYDDDQARLRLMAAQTQNQMASADGQRAQTAAATAKAAADKERADRIAAATTPQSTGSSSRFPDLLQNMQQMAARLMGIGEFGEAGKLVQQAGEAYKDYSAGNASQAAESARKTTEALARISDMQSIFAGVKTPQQHAAAVMAWNSRPWAADEPLPNSLKRFDPQSVQAFVAGSTAEKNRIETELKQAAEARQEAEAASRTSMRNFRKTYLEGVAADRKVRTDAYVKAAGGDGKEAKPVGDPGREAVDETVRQLKRININLPTEELRALGFDIAAQAKLKHARNPGLSMEEARSQAIEEARARGEIEADTTPLIGGMLPDKYVRKPGAITRPIPYTQLKSDADLKEGRYYQADDGTIFQSRKGKLIEVTPPARVPAAPPADNDLMDDEED